MLQKEGVKNILTSAYALMRSRAAEARVMGGDRTWISSFFLDSGAYSAWTQGVQIDINEYAEFIIKHKSNINVYAGLDAIGNYKETLRRQTAMEQMGLNPLSTFHFSTNLSKVPYGLLREQLKERKHIALGGMVGAPKPLLLNHLKKCFSIIGDYWPVKVHGFGMSNFAFLKVFPFYSVDATTWVMGQKAGIMYRFRDGTMEQTNYMKADKMIEFGSRSFIDNKRVNEKNYRNRNSWNIKQWLAAEKYLTDLWSGKGIKWAGV